MTTTHAASDLLRGTEERTDIERLVKGPNAYRTISEVADELHVPQHVLRFWETRFPEVKPLKRGGGRRYYSPEDIDTLRQITDLLYVQGYTIKGVQRVLKEHGAVGPVPVAGNAAGSEVSHVASADAQAGQLAPEALRAPFEIPAFQQAEEPASASGGETPLASQFEDSHSAAIVSQEGDQDHAATIADPGEETSGLPDVEARSTLNETRDIDTAASEQETGAAALAAILQDELEDLRSRQEQWRHERRTLRLALEDVLAELDNLRGMLPSA
ncbi:MerR family transcriptional regulator [Asaia krungthepensis]|uniref:MerR family transcriptional regulator n=1 Tax=Asaia krungthepensis NRIC 0535 TaxID=1307925 RepID=A0ABQ0Q1T2_9PROT|nr:MerR family transcriptional regulator [Asaia krungthepensis]GBQ87203.1 MerR family transcriptional regulator [Asaia krungthepensis NRIC 0535]